MGRVNLRIFTHSKSCDKGHSLLVCNDQGGLTDKVGGIRIQDNKTTFQDLRLLIEEVEIGGMRRRTAFYPEILFTMMNAPNPHGYSSSELRHYQFGLVDREDLSLPPTIIPEEDEVKRVAEVIPDLLMDDLIIVPQSQISRDGICSPIPVSEESLELKLDG
mmetsp:Transcript_1468/g.2007  ORF Transcript_1468/g.2007 Transcript_1468/m.2007 type:complete len:161 (+) Transcript_1468:117-599(+)